MMFGVLWDRNQSKAEKIVRIFRCSLFLIGNLIVWSFMHSSRTSNFSHVDAISMKDMVLLSDFQLLSIGRALCFIRNPIRGWKNQRMSEMNTTNSTAKEIWIVVSNERNNCTKCLVFDCIRTHQRITASSHRTPNSTLVKYLIFGWKLRSTKSAILDSHVICYL